MRRNQEKMGSLDLKSFVRFTGSLRPLRQQQRRANANIFYLPQTCPPTGFVSRTRFIIRFSSDLPYLLLPIYLTLRAAWLPYRPFSKAKLLLKKKTACSVLIVEDDRMARNALVQLLTHLGYHTVSAGNVAEGLAQLNGQQFAILDLNLPDGLGIQILEQIRINKRPMRVAIATGSRDEHLLSEAQTYRPDLLLRKPINVNVLLAWLEAAG